MPGLLPKTPILPKPSPAAKPPVIRNMVVMGDSLSDRGTLVKRELLGFIPMSMILYFSAKQEKGRFTNAMTWDDNLGAMLASKFTAESLHTALHEKPNKQYSYSQLNSDNYHIADESRKQSASDSTDIADAVLVHESNSETRLQQAYTLNNDAMIPYLGAEYIRTYAEGGLTAHDWRKEPSSGFGVGLSRKILPTLEQKCNQLLVDDTKNKTTAQQKAETLIIEWSGGNDLITVNNRPTIEEAEKAVTARMKNVEELIKNGYRYFVLFELPDLSLTPRFQAKSKIERDIAHDVCDYFNTLLRARQQELLKKYAGKNISVELFDINKIFADVKQHPEKYQFTNTQDPFSTSTAYKKHKNDKVLPSSGYMFWDDIHPTGQMHALLTEKFREEFDRKFDFQSPVKAAIGSEYYYHQFMKLYKSRVNAHKNGFFSCLKRAGLPAFVEEAVSSGQYEEALAKILTHGLSHNNHYTRGLLKELGWIDKNNKVNIAIPELLDAVLVQMHSLIS